MDAEKLKALKLARPFRPFYVILDDGRRLLVELPHRIGVAPDGSRMGVSDGWGATLLRPENVIAVDMLPDSVAK